MTGTTFEGGFRLERSAAGELVGRFAALDEIGVPHAVTTREGPSPERIRTDGAWAAKRLAARVGASDAARVRQVHGGRVLRATGPGEVGEADGLWTGRSDLATWGRSGDCPLVLVAGRNGSPVGFAHASWRSTVRGVTRTLVERLGEAGAAPDDLVACVAPSAGPCCYEVGPEVRDEARSRLGSGVDAFFPDRGGTLHFDLWAANRHQLVEAGLPPDAVRVSGVCTICRPDLFPSHRADGPTAGRFAAVIAPSRQGPGWT